MLREVLNLLQLRNMGKRQVEALRGDEDELLIGLASLQLESDAAAVTT